MLLLFVVLCPSVVLGKDYFTAAVFEHRPRHLLIDSNVPREIIASNLLYYEKAAKVAAEKGADIIVFNEYGLHHPNKDRNIFRNFMENVPDPEKNKFNPCLDNSHDQLILSTLSCIAKNNNMYVVANMNDIHLCKGTCDTAVINGCDQKCPEDGAFMYNADVVFDNDGNLVARYHKMQPYFENLNIPEDPEYVTFKTPFGTFGLIVCFDSVFKSTLVLTRDHAIDTLVFPTFWFDDIVPFNGVEWQQSIAISHGVNFLAANTQTPGNGSLGSGIYSKDYGALVYTYEPDGESKLLVANVPISKSDENFDPKPSITVIKEDSIHSKKETGDKFPEQGYSVVAGPIKDHYLDYRYYKSQTENYTLVKLESTSGEVEACNNGFCCKLAYSADGMAEDYYFGAFSGLNNVRDYYYWCEENCILLRCDPFNNKPCVMQPSRSKTVFKYVKISAEFTSERVYPAVSKSRFRLASRKEWKLAKKGRNTKLQFKSDSNEPLLKAGLMGRFYERDPPYIPFYKF